MDWRAHIEANGPGIYDMPMDDYHACHWSLSSSGARGILDTCPAKFRAEQDMPRETTKALDFGTVAHRLVLGRGDEFEIIDAADYRRKDAQDQRDNARSAGRVPMLKHEMETARQMVEAMSAHPFAGKLFVNGTPERSLFWRDPDFGIWCRCRPDWLPSSGTIVPDYKTTRSAHPDDLGKAMFDYGYYQQAAWYEDGLKALGIIADPRFVLAFQEKEPPYLVTVAQPSTYALEWGRIRNRKAREVFARAMRTGEWPGYAADVISLDLPKWAERQLENEHAAGFYAPLAAAE
jgi:PDDEXK-like domain of unknown function (DUF3799)